MTIIVSLNCTILHFPGYYFGLDLVLSFLSFLFLFFNQLLLLLLLLLVVVVMMVMMVVVVPPAESSFVPVPVETGPDTVLFLFKDIFVNAVMAMDD